MKSNRRAVGLSLLSVALVSWAAWIAWDRCASTLCQAPPRSNANGSRENEAAAATADTPEQRAAADADGPQASPPVDFSGQWQLDVKASDSMDPILEAVGLSFLERALFNNSVVTHIITQTAERFTIEVKTAFFSRTDNLPLNGEPTPTVDPAGRPVESTSVWSDDARQLITRIRVTPDQQEFTMTRSLDEGQDTMEVLIEFFPKEGKSLTSRRVYRRINTRAAHK